MNGDEELPEGWAGARLHEVASMRLGKMLDAAKQHTGRQLPYLRNINVRWGNVDLSNLLTMAFAQDEEKEFELRDGDVLVCEGGEPGRAAVWHLGKSDIKFQKAIHRIRLFGRIEPSWLVYHLQHDALWGRLEDYFTGSTIKHFTGVSIAKYLVRLPPLVEQRRIVAAVEAVLARVGTARERLNRVPATLKRFRQSVLAAACSGRLTEDWREKKPSAEPAATILARLGVETLAANLLPENSAVLPAGWEWVQFGALVSELRNGLSPRPEQTPPGNPILRINAVRPGEVSFADLRYLPDSDDQVAAYRLRDGDLLFTRYNGSLDLLGVCGMVRGLGNRLMLYPDKLMRVRFDHDGVLPHYCELFFGQPEARDRMLAKAKSSAGQNGVSGSDVKAQVFALPPHPEQREIVRRVDALFALANRIEAKLAVARQRVERLTQAVLAKAFRGELVPTEAELARRDGRHYEPASVLLERIQAERQSSAPSSRGHRTQNRPRSKSLRTDAARKDNDGLFAEPGS